MKSLYQGRIKIEYLEQLVGLSDILENAPYVLTEGGERALVESAMAGNGNQCQSRSRSTRSAGMSSRTYQERQDLGK